MLFGGFDRYHPQLEATEVVDGDLGLVIELGFNFGLRLRLRLRRGLRDLALERLEVDAGEQRVAQGGLGAWGDQPPLSGVSQLERGVPDAELLAELVRLAGDHRIEQDAAAAQRLQQGV